MYWRMVFFSSLPLRKMSSQGKNDEAFVGGTVEILETVVEQLGELAGVGFGWSVVQFAVGVEGDTGFGGVGNDEAHVRVFGQLQVFVELFCRDSDRG